MRIAFDTQIKTALLTSRSTNAFNGFRYFHAHGSEKLPSALFAVPNKAKNNYICLCNDLVLIGVNQRLKKFGMWIRQVSI